MNLSRYTVVITQAANQSSRLLELLMEEGFNVLSLPLIKLEKIKTSASQQATLKKVLNSEYDALVFLTSNGVSFFNQIFKESYPTDEIPDSLKLIAQGSASASAIEEFLERKPDAVPEVFNSVALTDLLAELYPNGASLLAVCAKGTGRAFVELAKAQNLTVELLPLYEIQQAEVPEELVRQISEMPRDSLIFTFFSPSAFQAATQVFAKSLDILKEVRLLSIGPSTSAMIMDSGCRVYLESEEYSQKSLVETLASRLSS
ncbi:MAG: uroporphyrinogen-III synthase [Bdellovibrionota bacterium]